MAKRPQTKAKQPQLKDGEIPVVGAASPAPAAAAAATRPAMAAAHAVTELVQRPFEGLPSEGDWIRAARAGARRHGRAEAQGEPARGSSLGDARHRPADGLARAAPRRRLGPDRPAERHGVRRHQPRPRRHPPARAHGPALAPRSRAAAPRPTAPDCRNRSTPKARSSQLCTRASSSGSRTRSTRRRRSPRLPGAGQRGGDPYREASSGVDAAYWCETPDNNHLRWAMLYPEEQLLDALARLHAAGRSSLGEGTRLVGSFRAHGLRCRSGTCRRASRPTMWKSRRPSSPSGSRPPWPRTHRSPRTSGEHAAASRTDRSRSADTHLGHTDRPVSWSALHGVGDRHNSRR